MALFWKFASIQKAKILTVEGNHMNKKVYLILAGILMLVLAGCSSLMPTLAIPPGQPGQGGNSTPVPQANNGNGQNGFRGTPDPALALEFRLAPGTLKLEGTANAVTAAEAKQLLPLWQKLQSLEADTNSTQSDIQAAYQQIEQAMTQTQIQTIQQMSLTQNDMMALAQIYGVQMPQGGGANGGNFATLSPDERATRIAQRTLTPGSGGFGGNGTPNANGGGFRGGRGFNQVFIPPLLQLLQTRAGG